MYYKKLGGTVIYFGKPYRDIFDYAKQFTKTNDKILMVGDTPWTDIYGANVSDIDSALVLTGIAGEFLRSMPTSITMPEKIENLLHEITEEMSAATVCSVKPTHILRKFA
jgi:ribonucleotide monophosphatase NagD (HAD superfamily)